VVEDCAGGMEEVEGSMEGDEALRFRDRVGLSDARDGSRVGAGVLGLIGSSTMYMGVSKSRNSARG